MREFNWQLTSTLFALTLGSFLIAETWTQNNQTFDEPAHIACGLEWWDLGRYTLEPQHPPLSRIVLAFPLYLKGKHIKGLTDWWDEGNYQIYSDRDFTSNLVAVRAPMLLFYWAAGLSCYIWGSLFLSRWIGALATLLFALSPPVIAHASIATTDIAITGMLPPAVLLTILFFRKPDWRIAAGLGLFLGLALTAKFSFLLFYPASMGGCALAWVCLNPAKLRGLFNCNRWKAYALPTLIVMTSMFFVVWGIYLFSIDDMSTAKSAKEALATSQGLKHQVLDLVLHTPLPAGKLFWGIGSVFMHFKIGHAVLFLGKIYQHGTPLFFPIILAIKTSLPFFVLILLAMPVCWIHRREFDGAALYPLFAGLMILLGCLRSTLILGVRHILPFYVFLAIASAFVLAWLWNYKWSKLSGKLLVALFLAGTVISAFEARPNYIAWFNPLAGEQPERIVVDSDLDLGQDLTRLARYAESQKIERLWLKFWGTADPARHNLPPFTTLPPYTPVQGWVAISVHWRVVHSDEFGWVEKYPYVSIGKTIRLYRIP